MITCECNDYARNVLITYLMILFLLQSYTFLLLLFFPKKHNKVIQYSTVFFFFNNKEFQNTKQKLYYSKSNSVHKILSSEIAKSIGGFEDLAA